MLELRESLRNDSALGEDGAAAIHRALAAAELEARPSVRTIHRILERHGVLDGARRLRRPPPPPGWYLPDLAAQRVELDSFDVLEDLAIEHGPLVDVLTGTSLFGALSQAWPSTAVTAQFTLEKLLSRWSQWGLPAYAQFDNDTRFQGPHQYPDAIGRVIRACLSLGVVPVFAPPREPGFQNNIENFNGRWRRLVWQRFHHASLAQLQQRNERFLAALLQRHASRREAAPPRTPFPAHWSPQPARPRQGRIVFLRRTNDAGQIHLLARQFLVSPHWTHRLVRAELLLDQHLLRVHALRRRAPLEQHLLCELPFRPKFLAEGD